MAFVFLDPRQGRKEEKVQLSKRLDSLNGKRIGLLWNNRPGGERILNHVVELLAQKYKFSGVYFTKKRLIGNAAPREIIEDLASRVDAVIVGVGD